MYINKSYKPVSVPDSHYPGSSATATSISKIQLYKNKIITASVMMCKGGYSNRFQNYIYVENPVDVYQRTFSKPPVP